MLKPRKSLVVVLGRAALLSALVMAPAMAQDSGQAQRVDRMVAQVGWQRSLTLIADGLIAEDPGLSALDGPQRACAARVLNATLDEVMRERLVERMTAEQVQAWLDFAATPAGAAFMAAFAANMQAKLEFGDDSQAPLPAPEFRAEAEAFMSSVPFMAFVRALSGQPAFNFRRTQQMHQRFQSDCGVSSPQAT
ncbi:hypothetical protein [Stenotrophomonas sp.]|uniref:hypothetical protein n=1 Tax=Stenotrophomonas sp. TaxID=69392 RepID=UPI00140FF41A|nr:hypothetical protein [Stenotrophomonas sp.]QIO88025.1 hypothetical protein G9274_001710 [Stenotrophomonas rhizophila]